MVSVNTCYETQAWASFPFGMNYVADTQSVTPATVNTAFRRRRGVIFSSVNLFPKNGNVASINMARETCQTITTVKMRKL